MTHQHNDYKPRHAANTPEEATIKVDYNENYIPKHAVIEDNNNDLSNSEQSEYQSSVNTPNNIEKNNNTENNEEDNKKSLLWLWVLLAAIAVSALVLIPFFRSQDDSDNQGENTIDQQEQVVEDQQQESYEQTRAINIANDYKNQGMTDAEILDTLVNVTGIDPEVAQYAVDNLSLIHISEPTRRS